MGDARSAQCLTAQPADPLVYLARSWPHKHIGRAKHEGAERGSRPPQHVLVGRARRPGRPSPAPPSLTLQVELPNHAHLSPETKMWQSAGRLDLACLRSGLALVCQQPQANAGPGLAASQRPPALMVSRACRACKAFQALQPSPSSLALRSPRFAPPRRPAGPNSAQAADGPGSGPGSPPVAGRLLRLEHLPSSCLH